MNRNVKFKHEGKEYTALLTVVKDEVELEAGNLRLHFQRSSLIEALAVNEGDLEERKQPHVVKAVRPEDGSEPVEGPRG